MTRAHLLTAAHVLGCGDTQASGCRDTVKVRFPGQLSALTGRREHVFHAAMLDPHTAAERDLDQIWALVDALLVAHGGWLPEGIRR